MAERKKQSLGKRICEERMTRHFTQRQLAAKAGLSWDGLKSVEQGRRPNPGIFTVLRIADALGITLDELINEPEPLEY